MVSGTEVKLCVAWNGIEVGGLTFRFLPEGDGHKKSWSK